MIIKYISPFFAIEAGIVIIILLIQKIWKKCKKKDSTKTEAVQTEQKPIQQKQIYFKKKYLTEAEKDFYKKLLEATVKLNVNVQMQINLASIIDKGNNYYHNELFRNVDFGIFDENFNIILLIELNDSTHFREDRIERDNKVKDICNHANIPLITFWVNKLSTVEYIQKRIMEYIES